MRVREGAVEGGREEGRGIKAALIISSPLFGTDLAMTVSYQQGITVFFVASTAVARSPPSSPPRTEMRSLGNRFGSVQFSILR